MNKSERESPKVLVYQLSQHPDYSFQEIDENGMVDG